MNLSARIYCAAVIAPGALLLLWSLASLHSESPLRLVAYMLSAALLATFKMRLPGVTATVSGASLVVFAGVAQLTLPETVLIAMSAALGQCLWNYLRRPLPVQVAFSVAALMISAAVTFACQAKLAVLLGIPSLAALVFCSSAIYFLVNTALIAGALAATEFRPPLRIWKQLYLWTLPHYIVGALVGGTLADASARASWFLVLATMPVAYYINHSRLVNAVSSEVRHRL